MRSMEIKGDQGVEELGFIVPQPRQTVDHLGQHLRHEHAAACAHVAKLLAERREQRPWAAHRERAEEPKGITERFGGLGARAPVDLTEQPLCEVALE